ncbi:MAG: DHA2 family efflux MFS transporter permease subunit [Hyphomicrobiaceae bacterium]
MNSTAHGPEMSAFRRGTILTFCMLAVTLYFTTILVVSTVLPQIQGALSATADEVSWIVTFNILAIAIATPMTGWLVARFGRKGVMCTCVAGFAVSTLMCGLATSLESLIFWRIVQGGIGAPTVPLAQTLLLDNYPKEKHQMVMGINGMGVVLGPIIGPTVAGIIAEAYGWRWAFMMLLPVAVPALLGLLYALPNDRPAGRVRLDWIGFLSLSVAVSGLQYVLARGQRLDWFDSSEITVAALLAALSFYIYLSHSLTAERPFIDLGLLRNRNLALGFILVTLFGMLNFTPMVILPTLLRQYVDYPDALIGLIVGSRGIGGMAGFFLAMYSNRIDARLSISGGFLVLTIAGYWMMHFDLNVTPLELSLNGILQGLCIGMIFVPLNVIAFSDLDSRERPEMLGAFHLIRNVASSLFISICVAEIIRSTGTNYARMVEFINPFNPALTSPWTAGAWTTESPAELAWLSTEISRQSAMIAYLNTFGLFTLVSAIAVPIALMVNPHQRVIPKQPPGNA